MSSIPLAGGYNSLARPHKPLLFNCIVETHVSISAMCHNVCRGGGAAEQAGTGRAQPGLQEAAPQLWAQPPAGAPARGAGEPPGVPSVGTWRMSWWFAGATPSSTPGTATAPPPPGEMTTRWINKAAASLHCWNPQQMLS